MISLSDILRASILIVDDQEAHSSLLEQTLRGAGYVSISVTNDPREVCEMYRKNRYSLVLLDLQMPGMDGFQVMEGLKVIETSGYLPVLVLTAQPDHKLRALKAGAKDFLSKPFDLAEVVVRVHNMLEVRLLHGEAEMQMKQAENSERRICASELSYRRLFEAALDGVLILDAETGRINDANPFLCQLLGYSHSEVLGQTVGELSPLKDIVTNQAMLEKLQKDGHVRYYDLPLETKDGRQIEVEIISNVFQVGDKGFIHCNIRDNSERTGFEKEILRKNTLFEAMVHSSVDGVLIIDKKGNKVLQNQRMTDLWNMPPDIAEEFDDTRRLDWVSRHTKNPDEFFAQVTSLYARHDATSSDEVELIDGRIFDRYSAPIQGKDGMYYGRIWTFRDITERKRGEKALIESRHLIEGILNELPVRVFWKDKNLKYLGCNTLFARDAGFDNPKNLIGKDDSQMGWRDQAELYRSDDRRVIESGCSTLLIEESQTTPEGNTITLLSSKVPLRNSDGELYGVLGTYLDITERKSAETVKRKLLAIVETSPDFIGFSSLDGSVEYLNPEGRKLVGLDQDKLVTSTTILDYVHETDRERFENQVMPALFRDGHWNGETLFKNFRNGTAIPAWQQIFFTTEHGTDKREKIATIVHDITEQRHAESHLRLQSAALEASANAIVITDKNGAIEWANTAFTTNTGYTVAEAIGQNPRLLKSGKQGAKFYEEMWKTVSAGQVWHGEIINRRKDGVLYPEEMTITPVRNDVGEVEHFIAVKQDITERKKVEAQFMRAQRMESIGTLAGGIAHDLNNILTPIMMAIEILKSDTDSPQTTKILETIEVSAKRGADIVRQVLSFARGLDGQRIEVQPNHLLKDLENIIRDTFPKDIRLQFSVPKDTWTILGDPTQVHQILLNLSVNARDAMPNGGTLSITVTNAVLDEQYAAMNINAKPGRYVVINVTDSGTGIPQGIIDQIFDPFFTTKDINKGTGLGLSTVMAIVKSHEGIINVYSELGKGTTFKVFLPAMEISSEAQKDPFERANLLRGNGEMVLVVDDEASILAITSQTLQAFGYQVLTAMDGADAVAVYARHTDEIAVVLTDMAMPIMDGQAEIHALMRINPLVKIIAASGLHANGSVAKSSGPGVKHFLTKPYTAATLLKTMREILDEA